MKQLSINHISAASIRANRKTYLSLAVGIVLAVLLATVMTLCAFGLIKALERKAVQIVGWTDCILLDEPDITDESLRQSGLFDRIGHQFVAASVTDSNVYLGWLDEAGQDVLCRADQLAQAASFMESVKVSVPAEWEDAPFEDLLDSAKEMFQ